MEALRLEAVRRSFAGRIAVDGVDLSLEAGSFFCLLGPSGCGKTTLLRLIGGYLSPGAGRIVIEGQDITSLAPERRGIGMVFQNYALFPHLSARANVAFGLKVRRPPKAERIRRVEAMLDRVGLSENERKRRPSALSGGQQQRVALARALVIQPRLLLLDEPFANLDKHLREVMRGELRELQRSTGVTTVLVTHDQEEALSLATTVGVMMSGGLLQTGAPAEVYDRPRLPSVARFLGNANILAVECVEDDRVFFNGGLQVGCAALPDAVPGGHRFGPARAHRANTGDGGGAACGARRAAFHFISGCGPLARA